MCLDLKKINFININWGMVWFKKLVEKDKGYSGGSEGKILYFLEK